MLYIAKVISIAPLLSKLWTSTI